MQDRGLAAYIAELVGTMLLVFAICTVVTLYVATSASAQTGSDFAVVGLVHAFVLFGLIITLGRGQRRALQPAGDPRRGGAAADRPGRRARLHPRPALRRRPRGAAGQGVPARRGPGQPLRRRCRSARSCPGPSRAHASKGIGTFLLVLAVCAVAFNPRARQEWAPLAIGLTLGLDVMIFGPLTGGAVQPGPLVRPGADRQRLRRTPGPTSSARSSGALARGVALPVRDRRVAVRARPGAAHRVPARWSRTWPPTSRPWPGRAASSGGRAAVACGAVRRVTFSRNYTLSLSRTCRCYCKYCAFATHRAHLYSPDEVEARLDEAVRRNAKELLVLTGERPEVNPEVARAAAPSTGHEDFVSYVVWACERALERGLLPAHEPRRAERERPGPAARGHRLAGPDARVDLRAADGDRPRRLADQAPGAAARDDRGGRRAADPVHERDPGRDRRDRGGADRLARGARRGARAPRPHPGGDPPELRPAPRYYGREVAEIADDGGARSGWAEADGNGGAAGEPELPDWATPDHARRHEAAGRASAGG